MKIIRLNLFEIFSIAWIVAGAVALSLLLLGIFNIYSTLLAIIIAVIIPVLIKKSSFFEIEKSSGSFKFLFLIVLILSLFLSIFTTPTIFGGRDEGSYSNSAIMTVNDGQRSHDSKLIKNFFDIYGPSTALNFPGFQYNSEGQLKSQFLPGYPSWLAIFYQLFGLNGLRFANFLPFITLILSFYLLIIEILPTDKASTFKSKSNSGFLKKYLPKINQSKQFGWLGAIFLMTFLPLILFYKFTLTEIYFASLLWFSLYLLTRYYKNKSFFRFKIIFIPLLLTIFIRIEAIAIIFALLLIMAGKDFNHLRQARYQFFFVLSSLVLLIIVWLEPNFFINAIKGFSEISGLNANAIPEARESSLLGKMIPDDWKNFYSLKILFNYNLLPFIVMALAFLFPFLKSILEKKRIGKEKALLAIPLLMFSPTLVYLVDANISLDHPWMFRRWIFTIVPLFFLYSILFLFYLRTKNRFLFRIITVFAILGNLVLFINSSSDTKAKLTNFFTFSQNEKLFQQTSDLSKLFNPDDLILLSQKSSGSGWSLIAEPMRNILQYQAVYFFNPKDYAEIETDDFNNVYLITTQEEKFLYENISKEKVAQKIIKNSLIKPSRNPLEKPQTIETKTKISIYRIK